MKYEFLDLHIASDGWPFYVQPDGTASDTPDPTVADLTFDCISDLYAFDQVTRGTISDHVKYAQQRIDHGYPCENDETLVIWYRGTLAWSLIKIEPQEIPADLDHLKTHGHKITYCPYRSGSFQRYESDGSLTDIETAKDLILDTLGNRYAVTTWSPDFDQINPIHGIKRDDSPPMENDPSEGIREMTPSEGIREMTPSEEIKDDWQDFAATPTGELERWPTDGKPDDLPVEIILEMVTPTLDPTEGIMYGHS